MPRNRNAEAYAASFSRTLGIRRLRPDEAHAFEELRDWLDGGREEEFSHAHARRLRVFFQDHPVSELRLEEEVERI